jgi:hypothetical protein
MVKVSTLIHRVDGFDAKNVNHISRELPDPDIESQLLSSILEPLLCDPGEELVRRTLQKI